MSESDSSQNFDHPNDANVTQDSVPIEQTGTPADAPAGDVEDALPQEVVNAPTAEVSEGNETASTYLSDGVPLPQDVATATNAVGTDTFEDHVPLQTDDEKGADDEKAADDGGAEMQHEGGDDVPEETHSLTTDDPEDGTHDDQAVRP